MAGGVWSIQSSKKFHSNRPQASTFLRTPMPRLTDPPSLFFLQIPSLKCAPRNRNNSLDRRIPIKPSMKNEHSHHYHISFRVTENNPYTNLAYSAAWL